MLVASSIPHGPLSFENLLQSVGLSSEREADAVRTIVIGLTAADAAHSYGVGASTVGSATSGPSRNLASPHRPIFLEFTECALWQRHFVKTPQPMMNPAVGSELSFTMMPAEYRGVTIPHSFVRSYPLYS